MFSFCFQDFLHANLAELINKHILRDEAGVTGQVIIELGRAETYMLRCARRQPADSCSNLPAESGSTMYQLLVQPDKVAIENLNLEVLQVRITTRPQDILLSPGDSKSPQMSGMMSWKLVILENPT